MASNYVIKGVTTLYLALAWIPAWGSAEESRTPDWRQVLMDKEGWIEGGAEFLYMSSTLTPTFAGEQDLINALIPVNAAIPVQSRRSESIDPEYNAGFNLFLRYRPPTNNDLGLYYSYLHNDGDGNLNRDVIDSTSIPNEQQRNFQDDKGHMHIHLHVLDFLFGRTLPINSQMALRLGGGLSYNDFHASLNFRNNDLIQTLSGGVVTEFNQIFLSSQQKEHLWGLGPKGTIDFDFSLLPIQWSHDLNFYLLAQFALLYSKNWSQGILTTASSSKLGAEGNAIRWENHPKYGFIPNISLDVGVTYRLHTTNQVKYNFAVGYRILTYWELDTFDRSRLFSGGPDQLNSNAHLFDDDFSFAGPYFRFSIAY